MMPYFTHSDKSMYLQLLRLYKTERRMARYYGRANTMGPRIARDMAALLDTVDTATWPWTAFRTLERMRNHWRRAALRGAPCTAH